MVQSVKKLPALQEVQVRYLSWKIPWRRKWLPTHPSSVGKESSCNAGDPSSIPGSRRSRGEGKGYPLLCSGLENSMDCIVHGVPRVKHDLVPKPPPQLIAEDMNLKPRSVGLSNLASLLCMLLFSSWNELVEKGDDTPDSLGTKRLLFPILPMMSFIAKSRN